MQKKKIANLIMVLIIAALAAGGHDNVTVVVVDQPKGRRPCRARHGVPYTKIE